jgi:MFS family permease
VRLFPIRLIEIIVPSRLGTNFRWLLSSTVVNNAGDGVAVAAGPLLVASLTRDPFVVSLALLSQWLPMLLFGVIGGVAADRVDRRRMVVAVNLTRAVVLATLVAFIVGGNVSIALVLVVLFVLGTAETFADSASSTLLPSLVARANAAAFVLGALLISRIVGNMRSERVEMASVWADMGEGIPG